MVFSLLRAVIEDTITIAESTKRGWDEFIDGRPVSDSLIILAITLANPVPYVPILEQIFPKKWKE